MKKIIFFSFLIFILIGSLPGAALSEDFEDSYDNILTRWDTVGNVEQFTDYMNNPGQCIRVSTSSAEAYIQSKDTFDMSYCSFILISASSSSYATPSVRLVYPNGETIVSFVVRGIDSHSKIEFISTDSYVYVYVDGVLTSSIANPSGYGHTQAKIRFRCSANSFAGSLYVDDFTTSSMIGIQNVFYESTDNILFTWSAQLMRSYPDSEYVITLYSITNPTNAGIITSWDLPGSSFALSDISERGAISFSRTSHLGLNYGLYCLELSKDNYSQADTYIFFDQLANPQGFPEILFLAGSNVETDIRDEDNNGGAILAGGSVYLYPDLNENGIYNITYDILESSSSITSTLNTVYNTTPINQINFHFSGLSDSNYYVSVDDVEIIGTNFQDEWDYQLPWNSINPHIIKFDPNYYTPGVWGYIKNSETQTPIKSATVKVNNSTFTEYIYTDSNGMYYLTKGMYPGQYTVTASKIGYVSSLPYDISTQEGLTTRKDIFLDKSSGSGIYYAPHDVTFTVLEYWYSSAGLPGVTYSVHDENETVKTGYSGSKGQFTVKEMDPGINYSITLDHNGNTYTEYIEPGLTEYNLVLNKEGIIHQYYNSWLNLTYAENSNNVTVLYTSSKEVSEASLTVTASNGSIVQAETLNTNSGTFIFNFSDGDYILQFQLTASDGTTAAQAWSISYPSTVTLFPASYPTWLKNTLFVAIIIIFLLAFGKSKNDIACGSVAVLTSFAYYFQWLTCSFNFVVLIWIIALGAIFLHYKRTGAVG